MARLAILVPASFRFVPTVLSHGWYQLPPFRYDAGTSVLSRPHQFRDGGLARLHIQDGEAPATVDVTIDGGKLTKARRDEVTAVVTACLGLTHDLAPFYRLVRRKPAYRWVEKAGGGRLLASPTVWEDLAKTLLTTNTTWTSTKHTVKRLVTLGVPFDGDHAFPTPERIAAMTVLDFHTHVRAGYRSDYLHRLATKIVSGEHAVESWRSAVLPGDELFRQLKAIRGFGDYAAGSMCRLLGRFDRLGLDSVCRAAFRRLNDDTPATDREIAAYYEPFGEWAGLALWMDVIKDHTVKTDLAPKKES